MLLALLASCTVDPAPEDLDGLVHWLWDHHADEEDPGFEEALDNLFEALDPLDEAITGDLTDLSGEQTEDYSEQDPALARGLMLARPFACTLEILAPILYALDQDTQYPDAYTAYDRRYSSDLSMFTSGEANRITWEVTASAELMAVAYTEDLVGGLRRVPEEQGGPALVAWTWIPEPAVFEDDSRSWSQDYQVEAWIEPQPGTLWHLYGFWRQLDLGGLDMDNDGVASTTLDGMADWDDQTEALCAAAR